MGQGPSTVPGMRNSHWKADADVGSCEDPACDVRFGLTLFGYVRRHHCRACGGIFCAAHSSMEAPLDLDANHDPERGVLVRVCDRCLESFAATPGPQTEDSPASPASDHAERELPEVQQDSSAREPQQQPLPVTAKQRPSIAGDLAPIMSMPSDWNWSSF
ncbi:hypothetical protein DFJ74DRAFT_175258 [Hyaloraphidium curvatum]|nr:hypothetical protein DFJ74DRAFT_175258 [Hyaloraphidium curvatum]